MAARPRLGASTKAVPKDAVDIKCNMRNSEVKGVKKIVMVIRKETVRSGRSGGDSGDDGVQPADAQHNKRAESRQSAGLENLTAWEQQTAKRR